MIIFCVLFWRFFYVFNLLKTDLQPAWLNLNDSSCDITVMILNYQQRGTTRHNTSRYGIQRHGKRINQALFQIRKHESILNRFFWNFLLTKNLKFWVVFSFWTFYGENLKLKTWNLTLKIERSAPVSTNCENCENCENFNETNRYKYQWELLCKLLVCCTTTTIYCFSMIFQFYCKFHPIMHLLVPYNFIWLKKNAILTS